MYLIISILDTGAGSSFIKHDMILRDMWAKIRPLRDTVLIRDVSNKMINAKGTIYLVVDIGGRTEVIGFYVV